MHGAGLRSLDGRVEILELSEPRPLAADEALIEVKAAGIANWDELVRRGAGTAAATRRWLSAFKVP